MSGQVDPIPEGFNTVSIHITVNNAANAIEFYKEVFQAEERCRMPGPDGHTVMHCELKIGNSIIMLNDECPGPYPVKSPKTLNAATACIHLYVEDADAVFNRAVEAGAKTVMPLEDQFWGDRYAMVIDPYGHVWGIATHKEDLTEEEINERAREFFDQMEDGSC